MSIEYFQPLATPLKSGINLIEASAGTGKTYAIALLVLRFIVEQGFNIEQLLVVTFTRAASKELKDRIRQRLVKTKQQLLSHPPQQHIDLSLQQWLQQLPLAEDVIIQRLDTALLSIDQASIFTIHGFCQMTLNQYALESGQLFDVELIPSSHEIQQRCTQDYWRKQLYPRQALDVSLLIAHYSSPDALLKSLQRLPLQATVIPLAEDLTELLIKLRQLIQQAKLEFSPVYQRVSHALTEQTFKSSYQTTLEQQAPILQQWLAHDNLPIPELETLNLFSDFSLKEALNGAKFRKNKHQGSEARKQAYLHSLSLNNTALTKLATALKHLTLHFRLGLVDYLRKTIPIELHQKNQLSFDDLITRLSVALKNDTSLLLTSALQQRFTVALIDEFQDTDDQQWDIFHRLFTTPTHFMYLIGDPKQAIYKFRGADIFSYFMAKKYAHHTFTLANNWRSHPHLVTAINQLFSRKQAFLFAPLHFNSVNPALNTDTGEICYQQQPIAPMMLWHLAASESKTGYWSAGKAAAVIQTAVVNEIVTLLTQDYSLNIQHKHSKLTPQSIAILVRTNTQAREYQHVLQRRGVPAVLHSTESIFTSPQAFELYQVLHAIQAVGDTSRLKQALSLDWFGLQGQDFYLEINDDLKMDAWMSRFQRYNILWEQKNFMVMMTRLFIDEKIYQHLSHQPQAERILSHLKHLTELIQQAATEQCFTLSQTLDYLTTAIQTAAEGSLEEQQLRLESDQKSVRIVTMHRSKGLEYPIVFCPVLWQSQMRLHQETERLSCHVEGHLVNDLGSTTFEEHRVKAKAEQLAEDLRILYVAVTRAKYRCYLVWGNVRSQSTPNGSALRYLLNFQADDFKTQQQHLQSFRHQHPQSFDDQLLASDTLLTGHYQTKKIPTRLNAKCRQRVLSSSWYVSSYTALAKLSQEDLSVSEVTKPIMITDMELPRGRQTGNVIHHLLEFIPFTKLAEPDADINLQRDQACQRYGLTIAEPKVINQLLHTVVNTPLSFNDENFCLKNVNHWQCIKEMPFYFSVKSFNVEKINPLLAHCKSYQALQSKQLQGYLTGFIDLVCEYKGQYYVMDYKTNYLDAYDEKHLIQSMRQHNYGLQYWLYSVVLHLYLQERLNNYNYQHHFGGVRYLFLRGMHPEQLMSGVYATRPDLNTLNALSSLFQ